MADEIKISALPAASAVNPADLLAIVQSGVTKKAPASLITGILSSVSTAVYVNSNGNDTTGNGSLLAPWKTIAGAFTAITDATITKQYTIHQIGSITDSDIILKPYINIFSDGSPLYADTISLDPSFHTAPNISSWYQNLSFASDCTLNLLFPDLEINFGWLNFVNPRTTRVDSASSPIVIFNVGSTNGFHHFNFYNPLFSENNDGCRVSIVCNSGDQAPLNIVGGTLPDLIDYSDCSGGWMIINGAQSSGSQTDITLGDIATFGITNVQSWYGRTLVTVETGKTVTEFYYDSSVGNPLNWITIDGTVTDFIPLPDSNTIKSNYSPVNFSYPTPLNFGTVATVYDAIEGIDNALVAHPVAGVPRNYISGFGFLSIGLTTVQIDGGICADDNNSFTIVYNGGTSGGVADLTESGVNGLDTGSVAANTRYYLYVIADTSGINPTELLWSASGIGPTLLPTGYNAYRYLLFFRTQTASTNLCTATVVGTSNERTYYLATSDASVAVLSGGNATSSAAIPIPPWVADTNRKTTKAMGFIYSFNPGDEADNTANILSPDFAEPYWVSKTGGAVNTPQTNTTGLIPLSFPPTQGINYYLSSGTAVGAALDLNINIIQEYI